jgi:hypothetical protein
MALTASVARMKLLAQRPPAAGTRRHVLGVLGMLGGRRRIGDGPRSASQAARSRLRTPGSDDGYTDGREIRADELANYYLSSDGRAYPLL